MYPYRVFVSYSHEDADKAEIVRGRLKEIGAIPMCDLGIRPGVPFDESIQRQISFAHVFMPILTQSSKERPWVHQEVGFAMGLCVPVLPLALDELPKGMAERIQAVKVRPDLGDLDEKLRPADLDRLVASSQRASGALTYCADRLHARTQILVEWAEDVERLDPQPPLRVRQRMAWGSFSIPNKRPSHPDWDLRDGRHPHSFDVRELLRKERQVMERHARQWGCDLILDPFVRVEYLYQEPTGHVEFKHNPQATALRARILKEFLEDLPDDGVRVVFQEGEIEGGLIIVGDLFVAEAIVPKYAGGGYRQTTFTQHGPTVLRRLEWFDELFKGLLAEADLKGRSSRVAAIETLNDLLARCEQQT